MSDSSSRWWQTPLGVGVVVAIVGALAAALLTPAGAALFQQSAAEPSEGPSLSSVSTAAPSAATPPPGARGVRLVSPTNEPSFANDWDFDTIDYGNVQAINGTQYPDSVSWNCPTRCGTNEYAITFKLAHEYRWIRLTAGVSVRSYGAGNTSAWASVSSGDTSLAALTFSDKEPHELLLDVSGLSEITLTAGAVDPVADDNPVVVFGSPTLYK
ncbi:hypothetical protein ACWGJ9_09115 [Curtobacterium citreum]